MTGKVMNAIIYPDSETYDCKQVLETVKNIGCEWFAALHDRDVNPDGTPKKTHYHIIMRFEGTKDFAVVARDLGIPENAIEKSKSFKYGVRYLIHLDSPEKFRYEKSIIFGNGQADAFLVSNADQKGVLLMDAIYSGQVFTIYELYQMAKDLDAWSEFRRGFAMYNTVLASMRYDSRRTSDRKYEADRAIEAELIVAREEMRKSPHFEELPQETIPEFDDTKPQGSV